MKEVKFIKNYATKKKGDTAKLDSMLAHNLVKKHKVAKYVTEKPEPEKK